MRGHGKEHRLAVHRRPRGYRGPRPSGAPPPAATRTRRLLAAAAGLPVTLALAAGCASSGPAPGPVRVVAATAHGGGFPLTPGPGPQTLSETGSTLLYPLFRTWAAAYHGQHSQVTIPTGATGSGAGIAGAVAGTADIGASDAYLSSGTLVQNPRLLNIPLAVSAQMVYYNLPSLSAGTHLKLDAQVLAMMYAGRITRWNDPAIARLNPRVSLPGTRVVPLHRSDSSGDTFLFTSYLAATDSAWSNAYGYGTVVHWPGVAGQPGLGRTGNPGMVAGCHHVVGCVAYVGLSYAQQARGLGEAELQNRAGNYELPSNASIPAAVQPFVSSTPPSETISMIDGPAARGYPIVNYEYAVVSTRQPTAARARDLRAFLHWVITSGQSSRYLDDYGTGPLPPSVPGFQPLPASVATLSDAQIAEIH
jgi:phosphate transport system substrate-binding protein